MDAEEIVGRLDLRPHPEGGWYRETWRDPAGSGSSIYYLLAGGRPGAWHRVLGRTEMWHFHAGDPLRLEVATDGAADRPPAHPDAAVCIRAVTLGTDLAGGHAPQAVVPPDHWQRAEALGAWTLVGCTVAPAFSFEAFELAGP
jgi:predicted cupin superfamily sugar epimerase